MKNRADILEELRALNSPLAGFPVRMPFSVPPGYFADASVVLRSGIRANDAASDPLLPFTTSLPFHVPADYFTHLPQQLLRAASASEEHVDTLPRIDTAFTLPQGYFSSLPAELLAKAKAADVQTGTVVEAPPARRTISFRPALRWAAAAVVLLGIGLGSYRMLQTGSASGDASRQLAKLDKSELLRYVQQNIDDFDEEVLSVASAGSIGPATGVELDLEEQDIIEYLDQNGWDTADDLATDL